MKKTIVVMGALVALSVIVLALPTLITPPIPQINAAYLAMQADQQYSGSSVSWSLLNEAEVLLTDVYNQPYCMTFSEGVFEGAYLGTCAGDTPPLYITQTAAQHSAYLEGLKACQPLVPQ